MVSETIVRMEVARRWATPQQTITPDILIAALGAADWLLVHSIDRTQLIDWLGGNETAAE
jgi:hypothetical protein